MSQICKHCQKLKLESDFKMKRNSFGNLIQNKTCNSCLSIVNKRDQKTRTRKNLQDSNAEYIQECQKLLAWRLVT